MEYFLKVIQVIGPSRDLDCRMQFAADADTVRPMQQTPTKSRTLRGEGPHQGRQPAADAEVVRPPWRAVCRRSLVRGDFVPLAVKVGEIRTSLTEGGIHIQRRLEVLFSATCFAKTTK